MDIFLILFIFSLFGIGIFARKIFELSKRVTQFETVEEQQVNLEDEEYPFNQTLKDLYKQIEDIQSSYGEYQTTKEGINTKLEDLNLVTSRLNRTLASNQKRGDWGEIQVEKILEDAGMVKGQHFEAQKELKSGKIPDITFKLPDEKILNLDVKFPLENYMNYLDVIEESLKNLKLEIIPEIFCEPGRAIVAEAGSTIVKVLLKKKNKLYINDGTYGSLFDAGVPNFVLPAKMITNGRVVSKKKTAFNFYGPTCDSLDYMKGPFLLPNNIKEGDYIELGQLGAYGTTFRTKFNGFFSDANYQLNDKPILSMYDREENIDFLVA